MRALYLVSVYLHIAASLLWLGGMLFLSLILVPALRASGDPAQLSRMMTLVGGRYRSIGWWAMGLLVVTGLLNAVGRWTLPVLLTGAFWTSAPGRVLALKLILVTVMFGLSALHDFVLGPRASARRQAGAPTEELARLRRQASWLGRANLILGMLVLGLAVWLVRG
jgi:putative copper resistance protein D